MTSACLTIIERLDEIELIGRVQTTDTDRAISATAFQKVWGCLMCRDGKSRLVALQMRHRGGPALPDGAAFGIAVPTILRAGARSGMRRSSGIRVV